MYQRLTLLLTILCISSMLVAQHVMTPEDGDYIYDSLAPAGSLTNPIPVDGVIQKWVHDTTQINSIKWVQNDFKSYRLGNISFRLRFPNNYDPAQKYPLILYMHGAGESAYISDKHNSNTVNRENQHQLYVGARYFRDSINAGSINAFILLPQLLRGPAYAGTQWDENTINPLNTILDALERYNGLDPDRVIVMGISAGGRGCIKYASLYPQRIASVISSSPAMVSDVLSTVGNFVHIPVYVSVGGIDINPLPIDVIRLRDSFAVRGGDMYMIYYPTNAHDTWGAQWQQKNIYNRLLLTAYWNSASKAQPLLYYQNDKFCEGQPINAQMGITAGFFAYEWQRDAGSGFTTIPGAVSNMYTATQTGQYRVRFKRTAAYDWSAWTPRPIVISTQTCALADTAFAEHFEKIPLNSYVTFSGGPAGGNSPYFKNNTDCQNGLVVNGTQVFTQDASGRQGGRFMLNNTTPAYTTPAVSGQQGTTYCDNYFRGDQVWRTYFPVNVTPNTNYTLSFYMGNQAVSLTNNPTDTITRLLPKINNVALTPSAVWAVGVGNPGWKKYSFNWYSGGNTTAEIAITNTTATGNGNDFVLDEISLVKAKPVPMPGGAFKNVQLWTKGNSITGYDGSPVAVWPNNGINGNALMQPLNTSQPQFRNEGAGNINFNPVTTFSPVTNKFMLTPGGFIDTTEHHAVHVYMILRAVNAAQTATLLRENTGSGKMVMLQTTNSVMKWTSGEDTALATLQGALDTIPALWSFSKNTLNTPSGHKRDIRKNGVVLAASETAIPFTGNKSNFYLSALQFLPGTYRGAYAGDIAELIYVLDSSVSAGQQNKIESYLAIKYGSNLGNKTSPVNYTASDGSVFWPADTHFQSDVFGIGTDSTSGLVQTISNSANSGSGNGTGRPGKGNLVLSAPSALADKQFLMIGNDSIAPAQSVIAPGGAAAIAVGSTRINRSWKAANKGGVGAISLSFDTTGLGLQQGGDIVNNYSLMIDNDGDGNFNTGTLSFFAANGVSGKKINFKGVTLNDGVVFTILTFKVSSELPALWLGFTAEPVDADGLLKWQTSDEINADRYVIEHSFSGISYSAIGIVTANNNSGVNKYTFTDKDLAAGIHYYRIRRVDKDGKTELSSTQSIRIAISGSNVQVRPNPVTGSNMAVAVSVQQNLTTIIQVLGTDGKLLIKLPVSLSTGNNLINLNTAPIPPGMYFLQLQLKEGLLTKKFIKQ